MPTYVLLMTLTPEGRERMLENPEAVLEAEARVRVPDVSVLGLYAVLGEHDFVGLLEAPDNETAARFSVALGVEGGVRVVTLPAIPIARLEGAEPESPPPSDELIVAGPEPAIADVTLRDAPL